MDGMEKWRRGRSRLAPSAEAIVRAAFRVVAMGAWVVLALSVARASESRDAARLMDEVQRRAVRFFLERADPVTGLVSDRASNRGLDTYDVASTAATGYGLAALTVGTERRWVGRREAESRAARTLRYLLRMDERHGFLYHFVNRKTGAREWSCEVSTIDTALCAAGGLVCGRYFGGEVSRLAERFYERIDWRWAMTNAGARPKKRTLTHGWKPEGGFLASEWDCFCELGVLYLLALGSKQGLPAECWRAWSRPPFKYGGRETVGGGPIFWHQMTQGYYDLRGRRDALGYDYWAAAEQAIDIHRSFCADRASRRRTYARGYWGLNAGDAPHGRYVAAGIPGPEEGVVSPTGVLASVMLRPKEALDTALRMRLELGDRAWGRYGFCNQFSVDDDWFGPDVIGIDLGMALLSIENHRTGLIWRLMAGHPSTARAFANAGLQRTVESGQRPARRP